MDNHLAPILLFAFKRPEHTRLCLESLAQNQEARDSELFVFIDGPRNSQELALIEQVHNVATSKPWCKKVTVFANKENRGVPKQVIGAVTQFCKDYGRVIVLEDDLILSPYFLDFLNRSLDRYKNEDRVMEVTGYMYPTKEVKAESGFMRGSCGWGWGTWQRAWQYYEIDGKKLLAQIDQRNGRYAFDFNGSYKYYQLLNDQIAGKIGGWDVRWAAAIFLRDGLTLHPGRSLVKNIGLDGTGTNTYKTDAFETQLLTQPIKNFPQSIEESPEMLKATMKYFRSQQNVFNKLLVKIKNSI